MQTLKEKKLLERIKILNRELEEKTLHAITNLDKIINYGVHNDEIFISIVLKENDDLQENEISDILNVVYKYFNREGVSYCTESLNETYSNGKTAEWEELEITIKDIIN